MVLYVCGALMFVSRNLISNLVFLPPSLQSLRTDETPAGTTQYPTFDIQVWGLCIRLMLPNLELSQYSGSFADPVSSGSKPRGGSDPHTSDTSHGVSGRLNGRLNSGCVVRGKGSFVMCSVTYYLSSRTSQPRILLQFHMLRTCGTSSICVSSGAGPCEYH